MILFRKHLHVIFTDATAVQDGYLGGSLGTQNSDPRGAWEWHLLAHSDSMFSSLTEEGAVTAL